MEVVHCNVPLTKNYVATFFCTFLYNVIEHLKSVFEEIK